MYAYVPVPLRVAARGEICGHFSGPMGRELARALETRPWKPGLWGTSLVVLLLHTILMFDSIIRWKEP